MIYSIKIHVITINNIVHNNDILAIKLQVNTILSPSTLHFDLLHKSNDTFLCFLSAFECIFIVAYLVIHYACLSSQTKFQNISQYIRIALYLLCGCHFSIKTYNAERDIALTFAKSKNVKFSFQKIISEEMMVHFLCIVYVI